jgi:hypothetical protein
MPGLSPETSVQWTSFKGAANGVRCQESFPGIHWSSEAVGRHLAEREVRQLCELALAGARIGTAGARGQGGAPQVPCAQLDAPFGARLDQPEPPAPPPHSTALLIVPRSSLGV